VEKEEGVKVSEEWTDSKVACFGSNRQQQMSLQKELLIARKLWGHEAALKLLIRGEKETFDNLYFKTLSR
jgi:hypothetical protein